MRQQKDITRMPKILFLILGMFTLGCNTFMIAGLFPRIAESIGSSIPLVSQGIAAYGIAYLVSAPVFSVFFAKKSVKSTLQNALVIFIFGNFLSLVAENLYCFLIGRVITGLGAGIFTPLCVALAVELGDQKAKGKVLSMIWGANSAGTVFGVPFAIFLSDKLSWHYSIGFVMVLALIVLTGFSFQTFNFYRESTPGLPQRVKLLVNRRILAVIGISCFSSLASLGLYSFITPIHKGSVHTIAVTLFIWGIGGLMGSSTVGTFVDKTGKPATVMLWVLIGLALSIFSIPFTKLIPYLSLISYFLWGAFIWAIPTPQQHLLFEIEKNQKTILSALNSSAIGLGCSLGTMFGGLAIASGVKVNYLPYLATSVMVVVVFFQYFLNEKFMRNAEKRPARKILLGN